LALPLLVSTAAHSCCLLTPITDFLIPSDFYLKGLSAPSRAARILTVIASIIMLAYSSLRIFLDLFVKSKSLPLLKTCIRMTPI
jgi:hypothetical protein